MSFAFFPQSLPQAAGLILKRSDDVILDLNHLLQFELENKVQQK
jgi:hypothetical protein